MLISLSTFFNVCSPCIPLYGELSICVCLCVCVCVCMCVCVYVSGCWFLVDGEVVERYISTLLTKTCLRWLITYLIVVFVEQMAWAPKANDISVPRFMYLVQMIPNVNRYRYDWIYSVQSSENYYHSSRSTGQERKFSH